jgi:hypothetical protein
VLSPILPEREAGTFEGFGSLMVEEALNPRHKAVGVQGPDGPGAHIHLDAAPRSSLPAVLAHQDFVAVDGEVERLDYLLFEGVWVHPRPYRISAPKRRLRPRPGELNLWMGDFHRGIEVSAIERPISALQAGDHLLVSVGHRPRSIAPSGLGGNPEPRISLGTAVAADGARRAGGMTWGMTRFDATLDRRSGLSREIFALGAP